MRSVVAGAVPLRDERPAQVVVAVVSLVLFAAGVVLSLWAYASAVERSRRVEIGVANLYLLTGATAPPGVKRTMAGTLAAQQWPTQPVEFDDGKAGGYGWDEIAAVAGQAV